MVPDKFNMVDMGGLDLIMMQGESVSGLYEKLMSAISNCQYQCLYHWMFDSVLIPPTYVQMTVVDGEIYLNGGVSVTSDDVIHIYTIEPAPVEPVIIPLLAEENETYNVPVDVDGFNPVTVDVPSYTPVINSLNVTENGTYNPPTGVDGYAPVTVNVQTSNSPEVVQFNSINIGTQSSISYEFTESGRFTLVLIGLGGAVKTDFSFLLNGEDFSSDIIQYFESTSPIGVRAFGLSRNFNSGDIVTITTITTRSNCGLQFILLKNVYNESISYVGGAGNNGSTFPMSIGEGYKYFFESAKWGYYNGNNNTDIHGIIYSDFALTSIATPNDGRYWYGGTYVIKF